MPEFDDRALYEKLVLDGFQAGLSWITILRKRDNFRRAFDDFAPEKIARYRPVKVEKLMQDAGIVRNRAKIDGTVLSARAWLEIMDKGPGFSKLLWDFVDGRPKVNNFKSRRPGAGRDQDLAGDVEGTGQARLQILRPDHRLRLHAGGRHGQRPSRRLPSPRGLRQARAEWPWLTRRPRSRRRERRSRDRRRAHAPGSACCRAGGSICSTPPRSTSRSRTSRMGSRAWRAGTDKRAARIFFRSRSIACWSRRWRGRACRGSMPNTASPCCCTTRAEYVIGDMISPFKAVIGDAYKATERRLLTAIHLRFGLAGEDRAHDRGLDQGRRPRRRPISKRHGLPASPLPKRANSSAGRRSFPRRWSATFLKPWPAETAQARYTERLELRADIIPFLDE